LYGFSAGAALFVFAPISPGAVYLLFALAGLSDLALVMALDYAEFSAR